MLLVVTLPALSVAVAVSVCLPALALAAFQLNDSGELVVALMRLPSIRSTTLAIPDLASLALIVTLTTPLTLALFAGAVIATTGLPASICTGLVFAALTLPALSIATNLSVLVAATVNG